MNHIALLLVFGWQFVVIVASAIFLVRAGRVRRERPELLRNGGSFLLPIILGPITYFLSPVLLLIGVVAAVLAIFSNSTKIRGVVWSVALGQLVVTLVLFVLLGVVNTYFVH